MPQPFPDAAQKHDVDLNDAAAKRPELAVRAAEVISAWSSLDGMMGTLFTIMLGADPAPGAAIYESIRSDNGRRDAFRAIADLSIAGPTDRAILDFILDRGRTAGQARDVIAHSLWGTQAEFPDAILFVDPKIMPSTQVSILVAKAGETEVEKFEELKRTVARMRKATTVWMESDFLEAKMRIGKLLYLAMTFAIVLSHSSPQEERDKAREMMLKANSELAAYVNKRSEGTKAPSS